MRDIREEIEEIIEESYLIGMSEAQIRNDLNRFIDSCIKVVRENVRDRKRMEDIISRLTYVRDRALATNGSGEGRELLGGDAKAYAGKAARNKRLILRIIGGYDPKLVELINRERFGGKVRERKRFGSWSLKRIPGGDPRGTLLKVLYALMAASIFLLLYLMIRTV